ncbi:hypothetical protein AB8B02_28755 [Tardiphaga sp. 862_B3_N4_1]|uniref:hypothetical protein n=1 Tax=unclassified Tardiphaga TaxID=2631404 RepID=UPI003F2200E9
MPKPLRKLFWWPAVVGILFVGGVAVFSLQRWASSNSSSDDLGRRDRGFYLAASVKNAALLVKSGADDNLQLLLIDFQSGRKIRLRSERAHLSSAYLSPDGARLLFSRVPFGEQQGYELVSCATDTFSCRSIVKSSGSIHSAFEISNGRFLYVSSPYFKAYDGRLRLNRNDIWMFDPAVGARQLTDFQLYELHSLSLGGASLYFSALGSPSQKPIIPKQDPSSNRQSSIFQLPFDAMKGFLSMPSTTLSPSFEASGIATRPSASADASLVAFLRTRTDIGAYRYDLVVADLKTGAERLITAPGRGFSRPVVIGDNIYVSFTNGDRVTIRRYGRDEVEMLSVAEIDDASVASAEVVDLKIAP